MSFELTAAEIARACDARIIGGRGAEVFGSFSIDSRTIRPEDCFIALKGENFDGHNFISEAIRKGARGIIFEKDKLKELPSPEKELVLIEVSDSYRAIYNLARYKRSKFDFQILAITGSNGKTTVKELSAEFLNQRFPTYKNYLNQNNLLGLSLNILNCSQDFKFAVFEIGISKAGEMDLLLDILKPDHGLITNIGPTHLEFLNKVDEVYREKIKLFKALGQEGYAFYSRDENHFLNLKREKFKSKNFRTFGFSRRNDYWIEIEKIKLSGTELNLWGKDRFSTFLPGRLNAFNISAGIAVALEFGVDLKDIIEVLSKFKSRPGRMDYFSISGIDIIDDSYNSNPLALKSALEFISALKHQGLKVAVLGDMLELGRASEELHYRCGVQSSSYEIDYYLCYGEKMRYFIRGLLDSGFPKEKVRHTDIDEIAFILAELLWGYGGVVLFKASRGMRAEIIKEKFINQMSIKNAL